MPTFQSGFRSLQGDFRHLQGELDQRDVYEQAGQLQLEGALEGVEETRRAREQARADVLPFQREGAGGLPGLASLMTDPASQRRFIEQNPFFKAMADESQRNLLNQQAARGKVGSGETQEKSQNRLLSLGNELLNQNITQRFNQSVLGANAAAGQATGTMSAASQISELLAQGANAAAAGQISGQQAQTDRNRQAAMAAMAIFSDRRVKRDIKQIGEFKDLPVYQFRYIWDDEYQIGFMAQEVQEVYPEAVFDVDGILAVDYSKVIYAH